MKKKILLFIALISAFVCLFAISSSATAINKDTTVTLDGSFTGANGSTVTTVNLYDADGDALIWYLDTNGKLVSAKIASVVTVNSEGVISFTDQSIFLNSTPRKSVIAVNLRDNVKVSGTDINWDGKIKHFDDSKGTDSDIGVASTGFQFGTYSDSGFTIQYFYFPKTAESTVKRMFQATPVKVVDIEPGTPISTMGMLAFYGAKKLTEIYIPNNLAVLPGADGQGLFQGCSSLSSVVFEENSILWNAGQSTFYGCSSLKKLYLPNSVRTIGSEFARSSGIEEFSFGAGFEYFSRRDPNKDPDESHMWVFWGSNNLKKVYMPASFAILNDEYKFDDYTSNDERLDTFDRIFNSAGSFTLFFTGTEEEIEILKTRMSYTQENQSFMSALNNIYSYDEYIAAGSPAGSCAVYDYNLCKAFYNDVHQTAEEVNDHDCTTDDKCRCRNILNSKTADAHTEFFEIVYADFSKLGTKTQGCSNEGCSIIDVSEYAAPIFVTKGYSIKADGYGITTDYEVNSKALNAYMTYLEANGKAFEFGIFIGNSKTFGKTFIKADGTADNSYAFSQKVNADGFSRIKCTVADFTEEEATLTLVMGLYVIDDGKVSYIQHKGESEYSGTVEKGETTLDVVTIVKIAELSGVELPFVVPTQPAEIKENF